MSLQPRRRSPQTFPAVMLAFFVVIGLLEILSYGMGRFLAQRGKVYVPHVTESYSTYSARVNPLLGWPAPTSPGSGSLDASGARITPAYPDPKGPSAGVSIYGDSFAWSDEVGHADAWGNILSILLKGRVANFGMVGYGTDQAYLRFQSNQHDNASLVILVFSSDNIRRNVNRIRNFIIPSPQLASKPRFLLGPQGQLEPVPLLQFTSDIYAAFVKDPAPHLADEFFIPDGPTGLHPLKFPYTFTLLRTFPSLFCQWLGGTPQYFDFFYRDHPSQALGVTLAIMQAFHRQAAIREKSFIVVLVPIPPDLVYFQKKGKWVYQELMDGLSSAQIKYLNLGPGILAYLQSRDLCDLYQNCHGHFTPEGYKLTAELVYNYLSVLSGRNYLR